MLKKILTFIFIFSICSSFSQSKKSFYDFVVKDINGKNFAFSKLKNKKVLIVNTASKCGYTPQYKQLQELFEIFGGEKFTIIGFPANNFMKQEPGTNSEIKEFCTKNYGVSFPMMKKISVKGDNIHALYKWLTDKDLNGTIDSEVKWNFQKYLINEEGKLIGVIPPKESPQSDRIINWIKTGKLE